MVEQRAGQVIRDTDTEQCLPTDLITEEEATTYQVPGQDNQTIDNDAEAISSTSTADYCYIVGLGLDCKFIDLLFKRSFNIFIKISLYLNFIVLEIVSKQTDTLIQELMYLR